MPKIAKKLKDAEVKSLKHEGSKNAHTLHAVGDVPGLMLQITVNGGKSWVMRTPIKGKRRHFGLGSYPIISLSEARDRARDIREAISTDTDPEMTWNTRAKVREMKNVRDDHGKRLPENQLYALAHEQWNKDIAAKAGKVATVQAMTFTKAVELYLQTGSITKLKNEKHRAQWGSTLETYAMPIIGTKNVGEITPEDIKDILRPIWDTKHETASRLRGRVERVLNSDAVKDFVIGKNPASKEVLSEWIKNQGDAPEVTNHPALQHDDVPKWWKALAKREGMAAKALQFAALCASRSGEVRGATWDEFSGLDGDNPIWTISAGRMKIKKNGEHIVPLSPDVVAILKALPRMQGENTVFFAPRGGPLSDMTISAVMKRMHEGETKLGRAGWIDRQSRKAAVPHGLRSTFKDWATKFTDYEGDLSKFALAHAVGDKTRQAYQRDTMVDKRRSMMVDWSKFLRTGPVDHDK
jgi:integrase